MTPENNFSACKSTDLWPAWSLAHLELRQWALMVSAIFECHKDMLIGHNYLYIMLYIESIRDLFFRYCKLMSRPPHWLPTTPQSGSKPSRSSKFVTSP